MASNGKCNTTGKDFFDPNSADTVRPLLRELSIFTEEELTTILKAIFYQETEVVSMVHTTGRAMMMIIFYRIKQGALGNYLFDFIEEGNVKNNNKEYHIKGNSQSLFAKVYEWIRNEGTYIPGNVEVMD